MLSRKDYKAIAAKVVENTHDIYGGPPGNPTSEVARVLDLQGVVSGLAGYMAQDNPNFDREKFITACYGGE